MIEEEVRELLSEYNYDSDGIGVVSTAITTLIEQKVKEARIDELEDYTMEKHESWVLLDSCLMGRLERLKAELKGGKG